MLVRFFKAERDNLVQCRVIKYCDRIWVVDAQETKVLREVVVEVATNSPPLHELCMLVPHPTVGRPVDLNSTWGDATYPFNSRFLGGKLSLEAAAKEGTPGLVDADGISRIQYFPGCFIGAREIVENRFSIIRVEFPEAVSGRIGVRLSFSVSGFLKELYPGLIEPIYAFEFSYFSKDLYDQYRNEVGLQAPAGANYEIPALMVYDKSRHGYPGGFDIFLVLPNDYDAINVSGGEERQTEELTPEGEQATRPMVKLGWRMRLLDKARFDRDALTLECGNTQILRGQIMRPFREALDFTQKIAGLEQKLSGVSQRVAEVHVVQGDLGDGLARTEQSLSQLAEHLARTEQSLSQLAGHVARTEESIVQLAKHVKLDRSLSRVGLFLAVVAIIMHIFSLAGDFGWF